jgi:hypothetical protein
VSSAATISPSSPGVRTARRRWPPLHVGMPLVRDQAADAALGPRAARGFPGGQSADGSGTHGVTCGIAGYGAYLAFDERAGANPVGQATAGAVIVSPTAEQRPARRRSC